MEVENEIWRDVVGYEGLYMVSSNGEVKSIQRKEKYKKGYRKIRERILKPGKDRKGYLQVVLCKEGIQKTIKVHRIVCDAFLTNPLNLPQVNHRNECKTDNRVENLEYCDARYNNNFGTRNERAGISISKAKKGIINTKKSKSVICLETGVIYPSTADVQRQLGFLQSNICNCCNGKRKTCGGYHWKYVE